MTSYSHSTTTQCRACGHTIYGAPDEDEPASTACSSECELHLLGWGALELRRDPGGWRHYLHGEPVSCGTGLELKAAAVEVPRRDDYTSDYSHREAVRRAEALTVARGESIRARYESPLATSAGREPPALLYVDAAGHTAVITVYEGKRLRWPVKSRGY